MITSLKMSNDGGKWKKSNTFFLSLDGIKKTIKCYETLSIIFNETCLRKKKLLIYMYVIVFVGYCLLLAFFFSVKPFSFIRFISSLCGHWMPSRRLTRSDSQKRWKVRKSQRNPCCQHALLEVMMMIIIIYECTYVCYMF